MKQLLPIILMIFCTITTALGQLFWKIGASDNYINMFVVIGFVFYGIGSLLMVKALTLGDLSKIHPLLALGFVWNTLLAMFVLGEVLNPARLAGLISIIIGVIYIGAS